MSLKASSRGKPTFGTNLTVDAMKPRKKMAGATKPRAIKNPGSRAGLKKGAGG